VLFGFITLWIPSFGYLCEKVKLLSFEAAEELEQALADTTKGIPMLSRPPLTRIVCDQSQETPTKIKQRKTNSQSREKSRKTNKNKTKKHKQHRITPSNRFVSFAQLCSTFGLRPT
jgi:hypothetical protein